VAVAQRRAPRQARRAAQRQPLRPVDGVQPVRHLHVQLAAGLPHRAAGAVHARAPGAHQPGRRGQRGRLPGRHLAPQPQLPAHRRRAPRGHHVLGRPGAQRGRPGALRAAHRPLPERAPRQPARRLQLHLLPRHARENARRGARQERQAARAQQGQSAPFGRGGPTLFVRGGVGEFRGARVVVALLGRAGRLGPRRRGVAAGVRRRRGAAARLRGPTPRRGWPPSPRSACRSASARARRPRCRRRPR
jgi:hypothetical protein